MSDYVTVNGVRTWYDARGEREPLVLLHGGFTDSRDFDPNLGTLADRFRLYSLDRRGHGRTPDVDGPVSIEMLTDDVIAFIDEVVGGPAHLAGFSAGGIVAASVASRRPDLVRRLALISTALSSEGWMFRPDPTGEMPAEIVGRYAEVSPDGREHFPVVQAKFAIAAAEDAPLTPSDIASPTLVMASDDDIVFMSHTIEMYQGIADAQLAIVPGTSHTLLFEKPALCAELVAEFLTTQPSPIMPVRRAAMSAPR